MENSGTSPMNSNHPILFCTENGSGFQLTDLSFDISWCQLLFPLQPVSEEIVDFGSNQALNERD